MKAQIIYLFAFTVGIFGAVACEEGQSLSNADPTSVADTTLVGPTWQLVGFGEADGDRTAINYDSIINGYNMTYTVIFTQEPPEKCPPNVAPHGDWCMEAIGYPNEGSFTYNMDQENNQSLAIFFHGQTKMGLLEGSKEPEFFNALKTTKGYQINGKELRLFYDDEKVLLFEPTGGVEGAMTN